MRKEQLLSAIGGAQTAYLQHSERSVLKTVTRTVTAVAACVAVGVCLWQIPKPIAPFTAGNPVSAGFGGWGEGNPIDWYGGNYGTDQDADDFQFPIVLPVYENNGSDRERYRLNEKQVLRLLKNTAIGLQVPMEDIEYTYFGESMTNPEQNEEWAKQIERITVQGNGITIDAQGDGSVHVQFDPPIPFENGYGLKDKNSWVNRKTWLMLAEKYRDVLGYQNPALEKDPVYGYVVYDATKDDVGENMVRAQFRSTRFYGNEQGTALQGFWVTDTLLGNEKLGDYPTVSVDRAKELWEQGKCIGQYADDINVNFRKEHILKTEILYGLQNENVLMPYYRFLTKYGAYYVPAVDQRYIADFSLVFGK